MQAETKRASRGVWLAFASVAMVLSVSIGRSAEARVDYCEYGDKTTLLIVDRTTFYDNTDREMLVDGLTGLYDDLAVGDRLVVHTITGDRAKSDKVLIVVIRDARKEAWHRGYFAAVAGDWRALTGWSLDQSWRLGCERSFGSMKNIDARL